MGGRPGGDYRSRVRLAVALALLSPALAVAQPVGFDEAIALADRTPRVRARERALEARRRGDADIGGTSQGLSIQATPGARILTEQDRGFEGQLAITHSWNLGDLTGARQRAAAAERRELDAERRAVALLSRMEAARRWLDLWRIQRLLQVLDAEVALARRLVEATRRAVAAGARTSVDEAEADAYLAEVRLRAIALRGVRHEASIALATAMGRTPTPRLVAAGAPPAPELPDAGPDLARVEALPGVALERLAAAAARAREAEVAAVFAPQLSLGAQVQRESPDGVIVSGVVGLTIPLFDRGQRERSAQRAEAELREGEHEQARLEAARDLALAVHDVAHQRRQERAMRELLVPALERLAERREAALQGGGGGTIFALLDARRRVLDAHGRAIDAEAARIWAEVRLWLYLAELRRAGGEL